MKKGLKKIFHTEPQRTQRKKLFCWLNLKTKILKMEGQGEKLLSAHYSLNQRRFYVFNNTEHVTF